MNMCSCGIYSGIMGELTPETKQKTAKPGKPLGKAEIRIRKISVSAVLARCQVNTCKAQA
jgi:hypothetical protein